MHLDIIWCTCDQCKYPQCKLTNGETYTKMETDQISNHVASRILHSSLTRPWISSLKLGHYIIIDWLSVWHCLHVPQMSVHAVCTDLFPSITELDVWFWSHTCMCVLEEGNTDNNFEGTSVIPKSWAACSGKTQQWKKLPSLVLMPILIVEWNSLDRHEPPLKFDK